MLRPFGLALGLVVAACGGSEFTVSAEEDSGGNSDAGVGATSSGGLGGTSAGGTGAAVSGGASGAGAAGGIGGVAGGGAGANGGSGGASGGTGGASGGTGASGGSGGAGGGSGGAGGGSGGAGGGSGGTGGTNALATCELLYGTVIGTLQVCQQFASKCVLSVDTDQADGDPGQPCSTLCAAAGGECLEAADNGASLCAIDLADPRPCTDATMSEGICVCSRGCGSGNPCTGGKQCKSGVCS